MGFINRFNLERIVADFNTPYFIETGTFKGDAVAYALNTSFERIISIELVPEIGREAKKRFGANDNVEIIIDNSTEALTYRLPELHGNCIFWLDAHFPGSDAGLTKYSETDDENLRLPLNGELDAISKLRKGYHDVIIIDDLRIYEDGAFENGNVPPDALPRGQRGIGFILEKFGATHKILKSYKDEGYVLILPSRKYKKGGLAGKIFAKKTGNADFYYSTEIMAAD